MKFNITLEVSDYDQVDFTTQVLEAATRKIINDLKPELKTQVQVVVETAIAEQAAKELDRALAEGVKKTNSYGEEKGEAIPFREFVLNTVKENLATRVDDKGRITQYSDNSMSRIEYTIKATVQKIVKDHFASINKDIKGKMSEQLRAAIDEQLKS